MRKTRYITYEKKRSRFIFQIRIPTDLRGRFGNRTTIRVALGDIAEAEALRRGATLADQWQQKFSKVKVQGVRTPLRHTDIVTLPLDSDTVVRAAATWRALRISELEERVGLLRQLGDSDWEADTLLARSDLDAAKRASRQGASSAAERALDELEKRFDVRFTAKVEAMVQCVDTFNAESLRFAKERIGVLEGELTLRALQVAPAALLPLARFFGTRACELEQLRARRLDSIGKPVRPKTHAKFERIANQLDSIIGERPVECLKPQDVADLLVQWRIDGNVTATLVGKLGILAGLLQPVSATAAAVCVAARPAMNIIHARRHPLSNEQLAAFRQYVETHGTHADDARLLDLLLLTGARLGEVVQLTASDIRREGAGYVLTLRDDMSLKTAASARDLPVLVEGMPELETWLDIRLSKGGPLFPDARADVNGHSGSAESKRLNRMLRKSGTTNHRVVLQSTRNTAGRALRRAEVDPRVRRRYLGHADVDIHDKHYDPAELLCANDLLAAAPVLHALALATRPGQASSGTQVSADASSG